MRNDNPQRSDLFDVIHAFVTASLEGELSPHEVEDFERLLQHSAEARRIYAEYIEITLRLPRALAALELREEVKHNAVKHDKNSHPPTSASPPGGAQPPISSPLDNLWRQAWGYISGHGLLCVGGMVLLVAALVAWAAYHRYRPAQQPPEVASQPQSGHSTSGHPNPDRSDPQFSAPSKPVARLAGSVDCRWNGAAAPAINDVLFAGQWLHLASGVAEIDFHIGAKVILQSPAALQLLSPLSARLETGKATVKIQAESAHGFTIVTPDAVVVDRGTEFGVEVTAGGNSKVHVFNGLVDVDLKPRPGWPAPLLHRLEANAGARLQADQTGMVLVEETGEYFIRSIDEAQRDRHVVAYWRFEDRPVGVLLPDTAGNRRPVCATVDSSFNGNDLYAGMARNRPMFSADVAAPFVPQTGRPNRSCLDTTRPTTEINRLNLYTHSEFSHAAPLDIQRISPAQWTVEASVKVAKLLDKPQGFLGRDANFTYEQVRGPARLTFQINARHRFAIAFYDADGRFHQAVAEDLPVHTGQWYHLAATSDGRVLRLYVDALDGRGYVQRAAIELPTTGSTALGKGQDTAEWTLGRAGNAGDPADWLRFWGWIDEVRISDIARQPSQFLFAPNPDNQPAQAQPMSTP